LIPQSQRTGRASAGRGGCRWWARPTTRVAGRVFGARFSREFV
jgi:hypothetical protein